MLRLLLIIGFATLLLMAGVASAFEPGARRGPPPGTFRQAIEQRREAARQAAQQPAARGCADGRRCAGAESAAKPAVASPIDHVATPPANPAAAQRAQRLSPDERAALRKQIDEAGRDVYRSPRGNAP